MRFRHTILAAIIGLAGLFGTATPGAADILSPVTSAITADALKTASADSANPTPTTSDQPAFSPKPHIGAIGQDLPETPQASPSLAAQPQLVALLKWQYDASGYTVAPKSGTYQVGRHGDMPSPRPAGHQSHHGVNSVWTEANVPGSRAADAPAVLMPNAPDHNATRGVFNRWRAEIARRQGVSPRNVDWEKVSPGEAWRLAEEQFQATNAPAEVVEEYFRQFNKYVEGLK